MSAEFDMYLMRKTMSTRENARLVANGLFWCAALSIKFEVRDYKPGDTLILSTNPFEIMGRTQGGTHVVRVDFYRIPRSLLRG